MGVVILFYVECHSNECRYAKYYPECQCDKCQYAKCSYVDVILMCKCSYSERHSDQYQYGSNSCSECRYAECHSNECQYSECHSD